MTEIKENLFLNTYGLVLSGGNSIRMGADKSMLQYFEKPQRYHVYELLQPFCEKVFISCNEQQVNSLEPGYSFVKDHASYKNIGPMAALLSAFDLFPEKNILLIGCDYPFLMAEELAPFSIQCRETPAAFYNREANKYEPMLAWYPATSFHALQAMYHALQFSLQQFLVKQNAAKYYPAGKHSIVSVDTPADFIKTVSLLNP
ncbi:MAG: NTP transferase domain-containing protein [Ferruginibacter sp.]